MKTSTIFKILIIASLGILLAACSGVDDWSAPGVSLSVDPEGDAKEVSTGVQLLVLLTVLSLAPTILVLTTSFTRIVVVLSILRNAIGTGAIPPSQVIVGLSLLLTFFIMSPVYAEIDETALQPYLDAEIEQSTAFDNAMIPIRDFMLKQTRPKDIELFLEMNDQDRPETFDEIPTTVLLPAFVISELRTAFIMGFAIFVPFLIIDMIVASVLLSMGMMMLPPSMISLPIKILLFVMVDGWYLIVRSLSQSFF